ncbi:TadE/TadG family type IV pilus assembly protein, partial [Bradyrhizobium sp.]
MRTLSALINRFCKDKRGNIAVIFGIACLPVLAAVGCGVDYSEASRMRAKLQSAADAAAVASISKNSQGWLAASQMSGNGTVATAQTDAMNIFLGNINNVYNPGNPNPGANLFTLNMPPTTAVVTKTGVNLTSTVTFNATVPTIFMNVVGFKSLTVSGSSSASSSLPMYLDFYVMLDVSGSMGLPSTNAEQTRLAAINPDNFRSYPNGCTFACHFQSQGSCTAPPVGQTASSGVLPAYSAYPTNGYCLGYLITRVSQSGYQALLNSSITSQTKTQYPMKGGQVLPSAMLPNVTSSLTGPNSLLTGNSKSMSNSLTAVTSCPTEGTDACIQLRADAVGTALNATMATQGVDGLFATANKNEVVPDQFRIGLYPFIRYLYAYSPLTSAINASPTTPGTINYAAANLATLLDTGNSPNLGLGSGGTHFENAFPSMNTTIPPSGGGQVGDGSSPTNTKPFVFLVTDGAQNFQTCCGFSGSNSATVMASGTSSPCQPLKNRGITVAVLYIPYEPIQNPTTIYNNEDNVANANIPNIPPSLQSCASPNFFFTATS